MSEESRRLVQQDADLDQTNNQKTEQANTQDASHQSNPRQDLAVKSRQSQIDQQRVAVTVQNQLAPAAAPDAGRICGRVLNLAGAGLADCVVEVFFGPPLGVPVAVEETDGLGRFRVEDLPPGFYSLRAVSTDGITATQWNLRVVAGGECRAQVALSCLEQTSRRQGVHFPGRSGAVRGAEALLNPE